MSDKLRAAAQAALEWLRDKQLDTWTYMDSQFYEDRDEHVKELEAALAEPDVWVGLTDEEIADIANSCRWSNTYHVDFARAIEAKLKDKNGG
jgi:hypothetical protein